MKQSVRDVRKPHRNDPELNGWQSLFAMMIEWYDFSVEHPALPCKFPAHDLALPASDVPFFEPYYEIQPV